MSLSGKVAVVTGGASGIGLATVERFVQEGARVVFCDLPDGDSVHRTAGSDGRAVAARLGADRAVFVECDVSDASQLAEVLDAAVDAFGGLDIMYNNAGIAGGEGSIINCPEDVFDRTLAVDLKAVWLGIKLAAPHIAKRGGGSIISTSSISGFMGMAGQGAYASAKTGMIGLTRVAAVELARKFIRVNCVCPGAVLTPMLYDLPHLKEIPELEVVRQSMTKGQPIPRAGEPADIANAVLWLASDESTFVTGQTIVVDGGLTAEFSRTPQASK